MGPSRQQPRVIRVTDHGVQLAWEAIPTLASMLDWVPLPFGKDRAASKEKEAVGIMVSI